jgi:hypothetical protein
VKPLRFPLPLLQWGARQSRFAADAQPTPIFAINLSRRAMQQFIPGTSQQQLALAESRSVFFSTIFTGGRALDCRWVTLAPPWGQIR